MFNKNLAGGVGMVFLLGAVVGATLGILYAPNSGRTTRGLIDEKLHGAKRRAEEIIEEAKDKAEVFVREAKSKLTK